VEGFAMIFDIKPFVLPHNGIIPGARGHKKQVIPAGTPVWCITYDEYMYWACYLNEEQALTVRSNLEDWIEREDKSVSTVLVWNFKKSFPTRVARRKNV
jgi:hypothetical protein